MSNGNGTLDPNIKAEIATRVRIEVDAKTTDMAQVLDRRDITRWHEHRIAIEQLDRKVELGFRDVLEKLSRLLVTVPMLARAAARRKARTKL